MMHGVLSLPTVAGKNDATCLSVSSQFVTKQCSTGHFDLTTLLDFEAEGAALPMLPPTILITDVIRNGTGRTPPRAECHPVGPLPCFPSRHSSRRHKSAPEHGAQAPSLPSSPDSSLKASRTTSNSSMVLSESRFKHSFTLMSGRATRLSWPSPQTHSNSEFMVFGGSGAVPGPVGLGTYNSNWSNFRMRGLRSVLAHLHHGLCHVSISPSLRDVSAFGDDGFHHGLHLSRKISITSSISSRNLERCLCSSRRGGR